MCDVGRLLDAVRAGDAGASDELIASLHGELRRLAASQLRRERSQALDATGLVQEAWLRIGGSADPPGAGAAGFRRCMVLDG